MAAQQKKETWTGFVKVAALEMTKHVDMNFDELVAFRLDSDELLNEYLVCCCYLYLPFAYCGTIIYKRISKLNTICLLGT